MTQGEVIGVLPHEGPVDPGEVGRAAGGAVRGAVQQLAEEVSKEPIPQEHREQIKIFHEMILGGQESVSATGEGDD